MLVNRIRSDYAPIIQNVITTADLGQSVNAKQFNDYSWGRFALEANYNGKVGYVKDKKMRGRVSVFLSGKLISTGAKSITQSIAQLERTKDLLVNNGFVKDVKLEPRVRNVVGTADLKKRLDLNGLARILRKSIYEPEQFPGLIYKKQDGPACLIFASGKIVLTGAKNK